MQRGRSDDGRSDTRFSNCYHLSFRTANDSGCSKFSVHADKRHWRNDPCRHSDNTWQRKPNNRRSSQESHIGKWSSFCQLISARDANIVISVFTASHNTKFLGEAYESLKAQTKPKWEWTLLLTNGAEFNPHDNRVRVHKENIGPTNVGYVKRRAVELCTGDVVMEQDHDDILLPTAIEEASKAFSDPSVDFVFSNNINWDFRNGKPLTFPPQFGWQYRDVEFQGMPCKEAISPLPEPQNLSRVWYAPDHFRAWRRDFYWKIGGHDPAMRVCDDHDLIARTYLNGKMVHIDKPLYFYRIHGDNAWLHFNGEIQTSTMAIHDKYIEPMAMKWAKSRNLRCIDLGGAIDSPEGYESVDTHDASVIANLDEPWPFEDDSVGLIRANDAIEHLRNPITTMNEAWRVLAHGGFFLIQVPSSEGIGADSDPTHVSRWNRRSFRYYTEESMQRYIRHAGAKCRFQTIKLENKMFYDNVLYVIAHLIAVKDGERYHGELLI